MGGSQNLVEVGDYDQPDHANGKASEAGNEHQASREPDRPRVTPLHRQAEITSHPGEFFFEIHADRVTGVIDMLAGPSQDTLALFPTRVVGLPNGGSAFTFLMFQAPGQPHEQFEGQYASLEREFDNLERLFG